jgi:tRNA-Thr(GGU) m(6)t(6)A37 methyltransferase TsaA
MIRMDPVAYFRSSSEEKADVPRQGALGSGNTGVIEFISGKNYEQALEDLEGMERLWVVFWMDKVVSPKLKVQTPRLGGKKGVFSTRSPHRPNPIGLSCVKLLSVSGLRLFVEDHDLLDGTPILDIKPYLEYADSFPGTKSGWIGLLENREVFFSELAQKQMAFLSDLDLEEKFRVRLKGVSGPSSSNRIEFVEGEYYVSAYKSWRCLFRKGEVIEVILIFSGYTQKSLSGDQESKWGDLATHRSFIDKFSKEISENPYVPKE